MAKATKEKKPEVLQEQVTPENDDNFLFAVGTPEGDLMVKIGLDGNVVYLKDQATLKQAALELWNAFQEFLPVSIEELNQYRNDAELGMYIREKMMNKLQNQIPLV